MANSVKGDSREVAATEITARRALIDAAKTLLPRRAPSTVRARELAEAAGVNYGLIHHYFGTKEEVFREALLELRDDFIAAQVRLDMPEMLKSGDEYLMAVARSQVDFPSELGEVDEFPIGNAIVEGLEARLRVAAPNRESDEIRIEARARSVAMLSLQIGFAVYHDVLEAAAGVTDEERTSCHELVGDLYRQIALSARPNREA